MFENNVSLNTRWVSHMLGILGKQPHQGCTRPKFGERYPVEGIKMLGILPYAHLLCHWSSIHSHKTVKVPVKVLIKHSINRLLSSLVYRWYVLFLENSEDGSHCSKPNESPGKFRIQEMVPWNGQKCPFANVF